MLTITIPDKYDTFLETYSKKLTLNGKSNLSKEKLAEYSREWFQVVGLCGEVALHIYHHGTADHLPKIIDAKYEEYLKTGLGDAGQDDVIEIEGRIVNIDIKTSHIKDEKQIRSLNLIVSENEYHPAQIYVSGFLVGEQDSKNKKVILAGWAFSDQVIKQRWRVDKTKYAVPVRQLQDMMKLERYVRQ
jgi:hypothetical protein